MHDRYPGYDVLAKRDTPSWNEQTRRVIDRRLRVRDEPSFFDADQFATLMAIASRIVPQSDAQPKIPVAGLVDARLVQGRSDGYRAAGMPREGEAWRQGLRALDAEARQAHGGPFRDLASGQQDALLRDMQEGKLNHPEWGSIKPKTFFHERLGHDIVFAYYAHPTSWNEIGFGGPAAPRGYVRTDFDEHDPWEATEAGRHD